MLTCHQPMGPRKLLSIKEAAQLLGVEATTIRRLIADADTNKRSTWRYGKEIIDLTPSGNKNRILRINPSAVSPSVDVLASPPYSDQ